MALKLGVWSVTLTFATLVQSKVAFGPEVISKAADLKDAPIAPIVAPVDLKQIHRLQGANHSLILGKRVDGDKLIHIEIARHAPKIYQVVETDIFHTITNNKNNMKINCIKVLDRKANGHGGWAWVKKGGIGAHDVNIHVKSERSHGFDFIALIYAFIPPS